MWWLVSGILLMIELAICMAPNTTYDAYTYHYRLTETFRTSRSLSPQPLSLFDFFHLNGELLVYLFSAVGGERLANVFFLLQACSVAAAVHWLIRRYARHPWPKFGALTVMTLPVTVHQSAGGMVDLLLAGSVLLAIASWERRPAQGPALGWSCIAGLFAGYAWGVKQSAPLWLLPLCALQLRDIARGRTWQVQVLASWASSASIALPWVLRTWVHTGNPFFPALPSLTHLPLPPLPVYATSTPAALPFGPVRMLLDHARLSGLTSDSVPLWVTLTIVVAAVLNLAHRNAVGGVRQLWALCGIGFAIAYVTCAQYPRFALPMYVLAIVPSAITLSYFDRLRAVRWLMASVTVLSCALGLALAGGKLWSRRVVLSGRMSDVQFRRSKYPQLGLVHAVLPISTPSDRVLVFDAISYRMGLVGYTAGPTARGPVVADWTQDQPSALLKNCRELGIRWLVMPFGYESYSRAVWSWARQQASSGDLEQDDVRSIAAKTFPEWHWGAAKALRSGTSNDIYVSIVEHWAEVRPFLRPAGSADGYALYEIRQLAQTDRVPQETR